MAQRAEPLNVQGHDRKLTSVVPVPPEGESLVPVTGTLTTVQERRAASYGGTMDRAARSYSAVAETSKALLRGVRQQVKRVCNERPLQVVAFVAGAAFVLGVAMRLWKSRRYA